VRTGSKSRRHFIHGAVMVGAGSAISTGQEPRVRPDGAPVRPYGERARFEKHVRAELIGTTGRTIASLTPLGEAGIRPTASWLVAEGGDAVLMTRSLPISKAMDDVMVAYAQNGEAIRPEQGYPARLLVPGWEGSISVKWLRRIKVVDQPYMTREETARYTDLVPDGTARIFSFEMDPKSVITFPSGGQKLTGPGFYNISGLAWSGRGSVRRVEVSVDAGRTWKAAALQEPVLRMAHTRFRFPWRWDGRETVIQSRCIDQRGDSQPTLERLERVRGKHWFYHFNPIQPWRIAADGSVHNALPQG
jgi:sulfane dehydrogenase subunit SoxC